MKNLLDIKKHRTFGRMIFLINIFSNKKPTIWFMANGNKTEIYNLYYDNKFSVFRKINEYKTKHDSR